MPTINEMRSSLLDKTGVVVGHGAGPHPMIEGFVSILVVRVPERWVICTMEGKGEYNWEEARKGLQVKVPGQAFAPWASRGIGLELPFWRLKKLVNESFEGLEGVEIKMEWIGDDDEPWADLPQPKKETP